MSIMGEKRSDKKDNKSGITISGITISLCMIVKNEEENLANCLSSVCEVVDEINIVDTGSTDRTVEIARQFTDRIFYFEWIEDFAAARNFSFSHATKTYIMWLDADDTLTPENAEKLRVLKETLSPAVDVVLMPYHCTYGEKGKAAFVYMRERLLKRAKRFKWEGVIHECIQIDGQVFESDVEVTHIKKRKTGTASSSLKRNVAIIEKMIAKKGSNWEPDQRTLYYYGVSLYQLERHEEALAVLLPLLERSNDGQTVGLDAYLAVYRIYMARGEHTQAFDFLTEQEQLFYDKSEYYCELGRHYLRSTDTYDKAYFCFQKALNCQGREGDGTFIGRKESCYYFVPLYLMGTLLTKLQMYKEALPYMKKALAYRPDDKVLIEKIAQLQ